MNCLELITIGIDYEGSVIGDAIMRPWPRRSTIASAGSQRLHMEHINCLATRRREGEMEARTWRQNSLGLGEQSQFIAAATLPEPDAAPAGPNPT
jgi:hypothetical protein